MNVTAVVGEARSWYKLVQDIRSLVEDFQNADETRRQFSRWLAIQAKVIDQIIEQTSGLPGYEEQLVEQRARIQGALAKASKWRERSRPAALLTGEKAQVVQIKEEIRSALEDTQAPLILWLHRDQTEQLDDMRKKVACARDELRSHINAKLDAFHAGMDRQEVRRLEQARKDQERHEAVMRQQEETQRMITGGFAETRQGQRKIVEMILDTKAEGTRTYEVVRRIQECLLADREGEDDLKVWDGSVASGSECATPGTPNATHVA